MASNNSKLNTEMKMAGTSFLIATLVFIFLKVLTSETKRLQTKRHKEDKRKRCAEIRAEQMQALKNIEMNSSAKFSPFLERRIKSDSNLLKFCQLSQSFTLVVPKLSAYGAVQSGKSASSNENVFHFDLTSISKVSCTGVSTQTAERPKCQRRISCPGDGKNVSEKKLGFSDNYKEWSLRRRDIEISAMNFDL